MKMMHAFCPAAALLALAALWPAPAQADARHEAYLKTAQAFVEQHRLPDGETIASEEIDGDFAGNKMAICDVDGDGKPELLLRFTTAPMASQQEFVCGFDEGAGKITVKGTAFPGAEYCTGGCVKEPAAHNQGLGGDFWPYAVSQYDPKTGKYEARGSVDAWSKKAYPTNPYENDKPFPQNIDAVGDGFVYFIDDEGFAGAKGMDKPVDTPVYQEWIKTRCPGTPIKVDWIPANGYGLKELKAK